MSSLFLPSRPARRLVALALAAALGLTAGCGSSGRGVSGGPNGAVSGPAGTSPATAGTPAARIPVRIGYVNVMDDAQAMLAKDAGLYEKHGLDAELQLFNSGTDLIKAIVGGQLEAGVLGFTNALTWVARGADLKIVGGAQMGYHSILARTESGIRTVADLKGRRLASQKQGSTADIVLNGVIFPQAGLSREEVNLSYVSPAVAIQSLAAGQVDAAFVFEPYDRIARLTAPVQEIYEIGKVWPFPCMVVITSGQAWNENREAITRLLDAQKEAIQMLQSQPEAAARLLAPRFIQGETLETPSGPVPAVDVIAEAIRSQTFSWRITPEQVARMQEIADLMVSQGVLQAPIRVEEVLDLSWQAAQEG